MLISKHTFLPLVLLASAGGIVHAAPIEPPMAAIPGGSFLMGSNDKPGNQPVHTVVIKPFKLGKFEVTVKEFRQFFDATGYAGGNSCVQMQNKRWFADNPGNWQTNTLPSSAYHPVTCIGWRGIQAYIAWLARETGKPYRLPTEAEWEYADRGGATTRYFFGNDASVACRYANIADRSAEAAVRRDYGLESAGHVGVAPCDDQAEYASMVGMYAPNGYGLYDTSGNVMEYVADCAHKDYTGAPADGAAWVEAGCTSHGVRGGSWHWQVFGNAARGSNDDDFIGSLEGFRLALDADHQPDSAATAAFEAELARARQLERARRQATPLLK